MREMGIRARTKRQFRVTTNSKHNYPVAPNLLNRKFKQMLQTGFGLAILHTFTYEGWLYLAAVMDLYSRKIVGWAMSETMTTDLAIIALKMAIVSSTA